MEWVVTWVLVIGALLLALYVLGTRPYGHFKKLKIPCTKPKPFIGDLGNFLFKRMSTCDHVLNLYNQFRGHGIAGCFDFLTPILMIRDPEIIKLIAVKDFDYFTDHRTPITEDMDPLCGRNMFLLQGDRWKEMRGTLSPAFTSSKMKSMFVLVSQTGVQLADYLDDQCKATKDGLYTLEIKDLFARYGNDVIATATFGLQCNSLDDPNNEFYKFGKQVSNFTGLQALKLLAFIVWPRIMKLFKITLISKSSADFFRFLVHGTIDTREKQNIVRPDMIHLLMQAQKGTLKNDATDDTAEPNNKRKKTFQLTDDDLTANAMLFFMAGFDTSSTLLCFVTHLLAVHPDIQTRVQQEIDEILEETGGKLTYEGVKKMKYMDMVISETLRLYPPSVVTDRKCVKPYVLAATPTSPEVHLKVGDGVSLPIYAIHHDPEFFADPFKFDPERFSEENQHNIRPFTFLPFGAGPRTCIGMRFALMEVKVALCYLLTRFDLEVVQRTTTPMVLVKGSFNLAAEGGFWLGVRPRQRPTILTGT